MDDNALYVWLDILKKDLEQRMLPQALSKIQELEDRINRRIIANRNVYQIKPLQRDSHASEVIEKINEIIAEINARKKVSR